MAFKRIRNRKVYEQSVYHYKSTPTIMLKGQWLKSVQSMEGGMYNGQDHYVWFI